MGSSSSKVAKSAARKYPTRAPGAATPSAPPRAKPAVQHKAKKPLGTGAKDEAIRADAGDPDFAPGGFSQRLHQMGVAQTDPTYSSSSTAGPYITQHQPPTGPLYAPKSSNGALTALDARQRIQQQADLEFEDMGRADFQGRRFLDIRTIVDAMQLRDRGVPQKDIEARLGIRAGRLDHIGRRDVLTHVTSPE